MHVTPIGVIRTPYASKYDAPRQPGADDRSHDAVIELDANQNFEQAVHDLEGFTHVWVIAWFHRAGGWKPKVLPPRSRVKRGLFATRSPHRPNPIGISVVRLLRIEGRMIHVNGVDLLDGTPILDIKPYLAYADAIVDAGGGWTVEADERPRYDVVWQCSSPENDFRTHVERVLSADPFPHPYRRIKQHPELGYVLAVRDRRVQFIVRDSVVVVVAITP
ncbi:MAG: tRNA (N6-threonylcarbamoyladenosine(37)-N6)-methyltransferase TrmO [Candidatus Kapabacteria bacterium]|nr:tRNA (N6-threonylcarbamoyladenosine(37)-N6)-methyltransferase TrmO [Candidatus Kapabacteria bacterium]